MKRSKTYLIFFISIVSSLCVAQDTIKFTNGDVKVVNITNVDNNTVHYTTESITKKEGIFLIKYANGKIDTLSNPNNNKSISESKKMVYSPESIYRFRLLAKSTELGKSTNNIALLRQVKDVRNNVNLQIGFTIAAVTSGIIAVGLPWIPTQNYDQSLNRLLFSFALAPLTIVFGVTAIVNNVAKKRETRKLTKMYNDVMR